MDPIITNALMTFGAGFTGAAFSKAKGPGQALDDIMTLVGFEKLHEVAEKKRAKREKNIKDFKNSIAIEIAKIPEINIKEPPLSIVGPALEASKFYIEENELRDMFAKLIASSMDSSRDSSIHSSFVDIIKQMSKKDAMTLRSIVQRGPYIPISEIGLRTTTGTEMKFDYLTPINDNIKDTAFSITNLERLGLIKINYDRFFPDSEMYNFVEEFEEVKNLKKQLKIDNVAGELKVTKGIISLTPYGINFCNICTPKIIIEFYE